MAVLEQRVDRLEETFAHYMSTTDTILERLDRNIERLDRNAERMDRNFEESKREARENMLQWGQLAEQFGRFAEDFVAPNIPRLAREVFGITEVQFTAQRVEKRDATDPARFREFDLIYAGQGKVIVVETKATARVKYLDEFAEVAREFARYFAEYVGWSVIPVFASLALSPDLVRRLTRLKVFALALGDRTMDVLNLAEVSAKRG